MDFNQHFHDMLVVSDKLCNNYRGLPRDVQTNPNPEKRKMLVKIGRRRLNTSLKSKGEKQPKPYKNKQSSDIDSFIAI